MECKATQQSSRHPCNAVITKSEYSIGETANARTAFNLTIASLCSIATDGNRSCQTWRTIWAMCLCGYVAVWLYGNVAMGLIFKISKSRNSEIANVRFRHLKFRNFEISNFIIVIGRFSTVQCFEFTKSQVAKFQNFQTSKISNSKSSKSSIRIVLFF